MILESVLFLSDVELWVDQYDEKAVSVRNKQARAIGQTYIQQRSILEINIGSDLRSKIETGLNQSVVTKECFQPAFREICTLLNQNAWGAFCAQGGLFGVDVKGSSSHGFGFPKRIPLIPERNGRQNLSTVQGSWKS